MIWSSLRVRPQPHRWKWAALISAVMVCSLLALPTQARGQVLTTITPTPSLPLPSLSLTATADLPSATPSAVGPSPTAAPPTALPAATGVAAAAASGAPTQDLIPVGPASPAPLVGTSTQSGSYGEVGAPAGTFVILLLVLGTVTGVGIYMLMRGRRGHGPG